jgi:hypothetical protein
MFIALLYYMHNSLQKLDNEHHAQNKS